MPFKCTYNILNHYIQLGKVHCDDHYLKMFLIIATSPRTSHSLFGMVCCLQRSFRFLGNKLRVRSLHVTSALWCPRPRSVRVLSSRPDNDALRAPAFEKNTQKGNLIEMAEGATTLKGLRAQMGKKNPDSRD